MQFVLSVPSGSKFDSRIDRCDLSGLSTRHEDALEDLTLALARSGDAAFVRFNPSGGQQAGRNHSIGCGFGLEGIAVLDTTSRIAILDIFRKFLMDAGDLSSIRSHVISILHIFECPKTSH